MVPDRATGSARVSRAAVPGGSMMPSRMATDSASSLECAPSLARMLCTWLRTVLTEMNSRVAMAPLVSPSAMSCEDLAAPARSGRRPARSCWWCSRLSSRRQQVGADHDLPGGRGPDRGDQLVERAGLEDEAGAARLGGGRPASSPRRPRSAPRCWLSGRIARRSAIESTPSPSGSWWSSSTTSGAVVATMFLACGQRGGRTDDLEVRLGGQRQPQAVGEHVVVVDDQQPRRAVAGAWAAAPHRATGGPTVSLPPTPRRWPTSCSRARHTLPRRGPRSVRLPASSALAPADRPARRGAHAACRRH